MRKTRRHSYDQVASKLHQAETIIAAGKTVGQACQALQISKQTLYRWRARHRDTIVPEIRQIQALKDENQRLRRLVADQALRIQTLEDAANEIEA